MRDWTPTVPAYATAGTLAVEDFAPLNYGQSAGDTPAWFARVETGLDVLEAFLDQLEPPTRVSSMPLTRMAKDGLLSVDTLALPVRDITSVPFEATSIGEQSAEWGQGPGWWFSEDDGVIECTPSGLVNWAALDTFGEGSVRLRTGAYDSGWLPISWAREVHFPISASLVTVEVTGTQRWKGLSNISLGLAQYQAIGTYTLQMTPATKLEIETTPPGTTARVQWGSTVDGPWQDNPSTSADEYPITLSGITVMNVASNLGISLASVPTLPMGTELWMGENGVLFECLLNRVVSDLSPQPNTPYGWEALPQEQIYRGICSAAFSGSPGGPTSGLRIYMDELPQGSRFHVSWLLYSPSDTPLSFGYGAWTYDASSTTWIEYLGNSAGDDMEVNLFVNRSKLSLSSTMGVTIPSGVAQFDIYGEIKNSTGAGDKYCINVGLTAASIQTQGVLRWYATKAPLVTDFSAPSRGHDSGLSRPTFQLTDTDLITTVRGGLSQIIESSWKGPDDTLVANHLVLHNPTVAAQGLLRIPSLSRSYGLVQLRGGTSTPTVRKVVRR